MHMLIIQYFKNVDIILSAPALEYMSAIKRIYHCSCHVQYIQHTPVQADTGISPADQELAHEGHVDHYHALPTCSGHGARII